MKSKKPRALRWVVAVLAFTVSARADLRDDALSALKKSATYYHDTVASHGGYVYYYSLDLEDRWGEGKFDADTIFVQPPGTPTVGLAYLKAFEATGDRFYLDAARDTAMALVNGQLESGGWAQTIQFGAGGDPKRAGKYRKRAAGKWNRSSLDDGQTQAALRLLALCDRALEFKHAEIHEAATYGLDALLKAQFANGAFPQSWQSPAPPKPVVAAKYPDYDWRTEGRVKNYWDYYTLNDNLAWTVAETLTVAYQVYKEEKYKAALAKLGAFLVLAQMPDPQPAWCQQYNYEMMPMWARKFEPAAITGFESQDAMRTLIKVAEVTRDKKYLSPIPRALAYLKRSLLPDGRVARFYELKTNKPLYMDAKYELTYDDSAAPSHYGWKQPARLDAIEKAYDAARRGEVEKPRPRTATELEAEVRRIVADLDSTGRWISTYSGESLTGHPKFADGFRYLSSAVISRNVETLSDFLAATR